MFSQQNNQLDICVLKFNLKDIENKLVEQNAAIPALDEENERKYCETMGVVQEVRAIMTEIELQKEENSKLMAKRKQLQLNCDGITKSMNKALETRNETENQLKQVDNQIELKVRAYEDSLHEKADRFRQMHKLYDQIDLKQQLEHLRRIKAEEAKLQNEVVELEKEMDSIVPDIPENMRDILGITELENNLKTLTTKCEEKQEIRDRLQKKQKYGFDFNI